MALPSSKNVDSNSHLNHVSRECRIQRAEALLTVRKHKDQLSSYFNGEAILQGNE